jgi:hypothetical protein
MGMPDETRRKVESVARAKKQVAAVQGLVRKPGQGSGSDEYSDDNGGAWLGTALHGLMESPRKSATSLTKIAKTAVSTRAAAGFEKPRLQKSFKHLSPSSPDLESFEVNSKKAEPRERDSSQSSNDDDDDSLDAPRRSRLHPISSGSTKFAMPPNYNVTHRNTETIPSRTMKSSVTASSSKAMDDIDDTTTRISTSARERIVKRLEQARLRRVKEEQEARKKLEIIPMFLL